MRCVSPKPKWLHLKTSKNHFIVLKLFEIKGRFKVCITVAYSTDDVKRLKNKITSRGGKL